MAGNEIISKFWKIKKVLFAGDYKLIRMSTSFQSAFLAFFPRHGTFGVASGLGALLKKYCISVTVILP